MPLDFSTCGIPYRVYEDGRVDVNGEFPAYTTQAVQAVISKIWAGYGATITQAARKWGLQPAWLVGIIYIESSGNPRAGADCEPVYCPAIWRSGGCAAQGGPNKFCAGGLMAFTSGTASIFGKSIDYYMDHPDEQIMDAAQLISVGGPKGNIYGGGIQGNRGDVLTVVKRYNGGSPCGGGGLTGHGGQGDYVTKFVKVCNTFVAMGLAPKSSSSMFGPVPALTIAMIGLGVAGYAVADMYWDLTGRLWRKL